jgi:predicted ATP-grasp superfamily ATP-dependent carboligase
VPVYSAGTDRKMVARSRWYQRLPGEDIEETSDGERLAAYLRALPFQRTVLFPCSDQWALAAASLPDDVAASHAATVAPFDVLRLLIDKELFSRAAAEYGVPAPRVLHATDLDDIETDALTSFFLKPRNSQLFGERFGVKALRLESHAQATELLGRMVEDGIELLLQEFVPGPPTSHVFLDGYVDRSGVMRACLARRRLRMHPRAFGNSTLSVTIPLDEVSEALDSLRRLFEGLGYVGLFDAEFKHDARDGLFKILEVNARSWWQLELAGASGLDVCAMAYCDALGEPLPQASEYRIGQSWVHPVPDLQAWWTGRVHGDRAGGFPFRVWFSGSNAVFSWDDPKPAAEDLVRLGGRLLKVGRSRRRLRLPAVDRR